MCVGLAVLCGPPTVGLLCFFTWNGGDSVVSKNLGMDATSLSFASGGASAASLWAAYRAQHRLLIHHFDEGGKYAYGYRKGVESLGEPLQIKTWGQFYRAAGPPVFARTAAIISSCFVAGAAHAVAARCQQK
mmetsp:Transcript_36619/g.65534  ORF Transcript_36619/g.65534 Transcript_36619/m.65534 type:complete len:132 (-) Transcript_36619:68-463(-)